MKKSILFFLGILTLLFFCFLIFKRQYFSEDKIREKQSETWEKRTKKLDQISGGKIMLTNQIYLQWRIKKFNSENHKIKYCKNEFQNTEYVCKIDGNNWFGSDSKINLPNNELEKLAIFIDGKYFELETSQMFNPNFSGKLDKKQFKLEKQSESYILYGFFSDGAGTYTTNWIIANDKSSRGKISTEEIDFEWQNR